jgi:hypothetical protein
METIDQVRFNEVVPPSRLRPNLPRDLETIILKCLQKEPGKRYASAAILAEDLDRFLSNIPIRARPVGMLEKAGKWCRRRPVIAGLLAFIVCLALASFVIVTALWQRAANARDAEGTARSNEQTERERAQARSTELLIANARYAWMMDDLDAARQALAECPSAFHNDDWRSLNRACSAPRLVIPSPDSAVTALAYNSDGRRLAGIAFTGHLIAWDAATGQQQFSVKIAAQGQAREYALGFTRDDRIALVIPPPNRQSVELRFLDGQTGRAVGGWKRTEELQSYVLSPDARRLVVVSKKTRTAYILDCGTGQEVSRVSYTTELGGVIRFSSDSRLLAIDDRQAGICVFEVATGNLVRRFAPSSNIYAFNLLAVDCSGQHVFGVNYRAEIATQIVILETEREFLRIDHPIALIYGFALSPDDRLFTACGRERVGLPVSEALTGKEHLVLRGFRSSARVVTFRPDSRELAVAYQDGRIVLWNLAE